MNQLKKLRAQKDEKKKSLLFELEVTRAEVQSSEARAQSFEARGQRSEEENKGLQAEVNKLQGEVETSWRLGNEKFLQCKEFDNLCSERASVYFEHGFNGCLTQFRANAYSEDEHPALFINVVALDDMPEEGEMVEEDNSGSEAAAPPILIYASRLSLDL
ncbi:kinesin-1 [Dorcoceras hygrometricum]|uniref:Kinesin-1 n=1 Tax=Dorcoceras hygrometricum TaxID=472368 RepID=A0A2Z7AGE8_9LAMI|nr:kinesin-1 [Dorcoceras hygrometricum]